MSGWSVEVMMIHETELVSVGAPFYSKRAVTCHGVVGSRNTLKIGRSQSHQSAQRLKLYF